MQMKKILAPLLTFGVLMATDYVVAQSTVIRNTDPLGGRDPMEGGRLSDLARYDPGLCGEYLALTGRGLYHRPRQDKNTRSAYLDDLNDVFETKTTVQIEPVPGRQSSQVTTTETTTNPDGSSREKISTATSNSYKIAGATPMVLEYDPTVGLLSLNGKPISKFAERQIQESCRAAVEE